MICPPSGAHAELAQLILAIHAAHVVQHDVHGHQLHFTGLRAEAQTQVAARRAVLDAEAGQDAHRAVVQPQGEADAQLPLRLAQERVQGGLEPQVSGGGVVGAGTGFVAESQWSVEEGSGQG